MFPSTILVRPVAGSVSNIATNPAVSVPDDVAGKLWPSVSITRIGRSESRFVKDSFTAMYDFDVVLLGENTWVMLASKTLARSQVELVSVNGSV